MNKVLQMSSIGHTSCTGSDRVNLSLNCGQKRHKVTKQKTVEEKNTARCATYNVSR